MDTPFEEYLDAISSNQSLKDIIGQHFFRKTPVFFALSYFALYNDYIYPKGGVGAFIETLVDAIRKRGGEIRMNTEVAAVDPHDKVITDATGIRYQYDRMIWAGDLENPVLHSADSGLGEKRPGFIRAAQGAILAHKGAESVFSVFLAVDLPPGAFGKIASGHVFYTPDRQGLGTIHTAELKELLAALGHGT